MDASALLAPPAEPTAPAAPPVPTDELPFDADGWKARITTAKDLLTPITTEGKKNIQRYIGKYQIGGVDTRHVVGVPADYWFTEQKKAQLFYRLPEVQLLGDNPESEAAAPLFASVLNFYLSPRRVNILPTIHALLFDALCPVGFGACKVCYETSMEDVPAPPMEGQSPDPNAPPIQRLAWSAYKVERIPAGRMLFPNGFLGVDLDQAPWLGFRFIEDAPEGTNETTSGAIGDDDLLTPPPDGATRRQTQQRAGCEIWYRTWLFDPTVKNRDLIRTFVWYDGEAAPESHRNSPYQEPAPDGSFKGMRGFPISVLRLRYLSDSMFVPSDCTVTRRLVDEMSLGRSQLLTFRDRSLPQVGYDADKVSSETLEKIERNEIGAFIGFRNGADKNSTWPISKGEYRRESFEFNDQVNLDISKAWAMGENQFGVGQTSSRSATEATFMQNGSDTRLDQERGIVLQFFTDGIVAKLAGLLQLFASQPQYAPVLGADGTRTLVQWDQSNIQGDFTYQIKADSQLRPDVASDRKMALDLYNLTANDPLVNRAELTRQLFERYGHDPTHLMQPAPAPKPELPKLSFSISAEDLDPLLPSYPNVYAIVKASGITLPVPPTAEQLLAIIQRQSAQAAIAEAQQAQAPPAPGSPEHPGAAEGQAPDPLTKHALDQTGQLPGGGSEVAGLKR